MHKKNKPSARPAAAKQSPQEYIVNPQAVFAKFCDNYQKKEAKEILWEWLVTALGKSPSLYDQGLERSNLFFFYENIEGLLDAVYALHTKQDKTPPPAAKPSTPNG